MSNQEVKRLFDKTFSLLNDISEAAQPTPQPTTRNEELFHTALSLLCAEAASSAQQAKALRTVMIHKAQERLR